MEEQWDENKAKLHRIHCEWCECERRQEIYENISFVTVENEPGRQNPHIPWYGACVGRARATLLFTLNKLFGRRWLDSNDSLVAFARDKHSTFTLKSSLTFYAPAVVPAPNYLQSSEHVPSVCAPVPVYCSTRSFLLLEFPTCGSCLSVLLGGHSEHSTHTGAHEKTFSIRAFGYWQHVW